jgi:hypothetical protein
MGYSTDMFDEIAALALPKGARFMDMGSQDAALFDKTDWERINRFLRSHGAAALSEPEQWPSVIEAKSVFEAAGYTYFRCDVDERPDTIFVDLARLCFPKQLRASMDLVANVGTTEHLANPVGGFALIHYLTKVGGIMFHDVPLFGYGNHGLTNPTPKFWHALRWMNTYELVSARVSRTDEARFDGGNFFHDYLSYIRGLDEVRDNSMTIRVVLRKTCDRVFIPPYDAVLSARDGSAEAKIVWGSLYPFVRTGAYGKDEVIAGINDFLAMMGRPCRLSDAEPEPVLAQQSSGSNKLRGLIGRLRARFGG